MGKKATNTIDPDTLPAPTTAENRLLCAIANNDLSGFYNALAEKPQVNHDNGKPLVYAAITDNQLYMKELILRGADISHAVHELKKERDAIPRTRKTDYWGDVSYSYKKGGRKKHADLGTYIKRLNDYQKTFIQDIAPVESVRIQFRTLQEIQEMKTEMLDAIHGKPLAKQPMPAPAHFVHKPQKPEGT